VDPTVALARIAHLLERRRVPLYRSRAFRRAAERLRELGPNEVRQRLEAGTLGEVAGIGETTLQVVTEAVRGETPAYLARLEADKSDAGEAASATTALRARLRGDCHAHTDWSDGKSSIEQMAETARALGHDYLVVTDHSPRLAIAHGLTPERLRQQLGEIARLNERFAPFRILTGIEVDILVDGTLDQDPELLERLDLVVASVHSKLRMDGAAMTARMIAAIHNPNMDVLGHCTGRIVVGKGRAESSFDPERVFEACAQYDKAIEINSRPERLDPPRRLLRAARELGCRFSIDTDAHAPGQLEWQEIGCERALECGVEAAAIVNTWDAARLLAWTATHVS
jgi:putative hydrolase